MTTQTVLTLALLAGIMLGMGLTLIVADEPNDAAC
jgi:hypothetical protein